MTEPQWLTLARADLGVAEIAGPSANPRIMAYYRAAGAGWAKDDAVPWCGAGMAAWVAAAGLPVPVEAARARAWLDWGTVLEQPRVGAITVLKRGPDERSGHVCQWLEDRGDRILVLGANQGDAVSITSYPKRDVLGYRWPPGAPLDVPEAPPLVMVPARPLPKSGTIWGALAGLGASAGAYADAALKGGLEWTATLTEMAPIKAAVLEAGANAKSMALGFGVTACVLVISRRIKAAHEGRSG